MGGVDQVTAGQWEQIYKWMGQSGDRERWKQLRASGGWLEDGRSGEMRERTLADRPNRVIQGGGHETFFIISHSTNNGNYFPLEQLSKPTVLLHYCQQSVCHLKEG